jgi:hypothetical protein
MVTYCSNLGNPGYSQALISNATRYRRQINMKVRASNIDKIECQNEPMTYEIELRGTLE